MECFIWILDIHIKGTNRSNLPPLYFVTTILEGTGPYSATDSNSKNLNPNKQTNQLDYPGQKLEGFSSTAASRDRPTEGRAAL